MKKQMTVRKTVLAGIISCNWTDSSIYYHADPGQSERCFAPCTFRYYCVDIFSEDRMA